MPILINCPECDKEIILKHLNVGDEFKCPHCDLRGAVPESATPVTSDRLREWQEKTYGGISESYKTVSTVDTGESRFPGVRVLSGVIKVFAWIEAAAFVLIGLVVLKGSAAVAIGCFAFGALTLITFLAVGELLMVLLAIEENTRKSQE